MHSQVFLPDDSCLSVENVCVYSDLAKVEVTVCSRIENATCPSCGCKSTKIHSRYNRRLSDLPWQGLSVVLIWRTRKFFCRVEDCQQRIFTERLPEVARPHGRRTERLSLAIRCIALACGGQGGSRLATRLGMVFSPDLFLRESRRTKLPQQPTPRVLGIDDWAFRKGQRYGTVLIDLENNRPVDLLPDRNSDSVKKWLQDRPGVEIISRDRGDCYIKGASEGAPGAIQVADRFHLMQNLREALARLFERHSKQVGAAVRQHAGCKADFDVDRRNHSIADNEQSVDTKTKSMASQRRFERYSDVIALSQQGIPQREIVRRLNINRATVRRFIQADSYPERKTRPSTSHADPCVDYLWARWKEGCHNVKQLTKEIIERGFIASYYSVRRRVSQWRRNVNAQSKTPPVRTKMESPKQLSWMVFKADQDLSDDDRSIKALVFEQCPEVAKGWNIASAFIHLFKKKIGQDMRPWLDSALQENAPNELRSFAKGILRDFPAVVAAITLPYSNGQTEG